MRPRVLRRIMIVAGLLFIGVGIYLALAEAGDALVGIVMGAGILLGIAAMLTPNR